MQLIEIWLQSVDVMRGWELFTKSPTPMVAVNSHNYAVKEEGAI